MSWINTLVTPGVLLNTSKCIFTLYYHYSLQGHQWPHFVKEEKLTKKQAESWAGTEFIPALLLLQAEGRSRTEGGPSALINKPEQTI